MRARDVAVFVVGVAIGWPALAFSKGQWCNKPPSEGRRVALSAKSSLVDGVPTVPVTPADAGTDGSELGLVSTVHGIVDATVQDPRAGTRTIRLRRQP